MRVLWLSHLIPYPPKGGTLQRAYHLLCGVAKRNEVSLLCFNQRQLVGTPELRISLLEQLRQVVDISDVIDIPGDGSSLTKATVAAAAAIRGSCYTNEWLKSAQFYSAVKAAVARFEPHLIHFDTISLAPYLELVRTRAVSLNHHNIESHMMARRASLERRSVMKLYYKYESASILRYERRVVPLFDVNLTCSDVDSMRLSEIAPHSRVSTVPNGVDLEYFVNHRDIGEQVEASLIFVGGLSWYPNASAVKFLVDQVWPLLVTELPSVSMQIIGRNPPAWLVDAAARDCRLSVLGFVEDIRPFVERAAIYVCPIFDGGGTKLKILDAMAMAKAIVAHPIAIEGIQAEPGVHLLTAVSPHDFVNQIKVLSSDAEFRRRLGTNARALVESRYSFAEIGANLSHLYEQVARERASST